MNLQLREKNGQNYEINQTVTISVFIFYSLAKFYIFSKNIAIALPYLLKLLISIHHAFIQCKVGNNLKKMIFVSDCANCFLQIRNLVLLKLELDSLECVKNIPFTLKRYFLITKIGFFFLSKKIQVIFSQNKQNNLLLLVLG